MGSEVGDTVPVSQTVPNVTTWPPHSDHTFTYPVWQDPPKYRCPKCNKTFDFPEYVLHDTRKGEKKWQSAIAHCPHCDEKWEQ